MTVSWREAARKRLSPADLRVYTDTDTAGALQLDVLCARLGLDVEQAPDIEEDAQLIYAGTGAPCIRLGRLEATARRKRFSCAYLLGHVVLHVQEGTPWARPAVTVGVAHDSWEAQANAYAINLLIPFKHLQAAHRGGCWSGEALADVFGVNVSLVHQQFGRLHKMR